MDTQLCYQVQRKFPHAPLTSLQHSHYCDFHYYFIRFKKIIWLDALGPSCGTQGLHCGAQALESAARV